MKMHATENGDLALEAIPAQLTALLRLIPKAAREGETHAKKRFYPDPCNLEEEEIRRDWETFVKPSLRHLFRSACETVELDLVQLNSPHKKGWNLTLPRAHFPAWLSCLNQARLSIAEQIGYTEADQDKTTTSVRPTERDLKLFQMDFYAFIQESLLQTLADLNADDDNTPEA